MKRSKRLEFDIYLINVFIFTEFVCVLCCKMLHVKLLENGALYFFTYPNIIWPFTKINKSLKSRKSRNKIMFDDPNWSEVS